MKSSARFKFLTGDVNYVDYGGKWIRKVGDGRYHVIELINWNEHDSDPEFTYNVDLTEVDLGALPQSALEDAYRFCGWDGDEDFLDNDAAKVECLHGYGHKAPIWDRSGNNYRELMKEARAESAALDDPATHEAAMSRPVNKLGSTAREFAQGDFKSAMVRGVAANDITAKTMAKIHGVKSEDIEAIAAAAKRHPVAISFSVNLKKIQSDDPLAYVVGYAHAVAGKGLPSKRKGLASAYVDGYHFGVDVKTGKTEPPTWASA